MFLRSITELYSLRLPATLIINLKRCRGSGWRLLYWFWRVTRFEPDRRLTDPERSVAVLMGLGMVAQIVVGIDLLVQWAQNGRAGAWEFGVALLLSYPLVWAHLAIVTMWAWNLMWAVTHPKDGARSLVCTILEMQVRQLRARHRFKVVAVVGSVGKTSTKLAVAQLLGRQMRVRYQTGNYNDRVTVPLVFFGLPEPSLYNVFAWIKALGVTQSEIALPYPYDVVVVELGTDGPGQLQEFAYLKPDIAVVTAVSEEHMEYFGTLDRVAAEELRVFDFSKRVLVNGDDIGGEYLAGREFVEYSLLSEQAHYSAIAKLKGLRGQKLSIKMPHGSLTTDICYLGGQGAKTALAAAAVADMLEIKHAAIAEGLHELRPFSGRMQILPGTKATTIIDDTYNASPLAVKAALDVLYACRTGQRIAILGSMNELGTYSRTAHEEIGAYCDPGKLDVVVTIGKDAKKWLAPIARERGCMVHTFTSPYDAGAYVSGRLQKGAVVLAKGSQNGVFAEEAVRLLLADPADVAKLVRQSPYWMTRKSRQFSR
jgi:UDP-N-acetylmuramoyl-tripeptide--D-alanyl-D-alanine ligase